MGVLGLWNLLEPVGKPVPVETLGKNILLTVQLGLTGRPAANYI